jgi:Fimbrial assembly protein (PilN)
MANNESFLPEDYLQKKIATRTNAICITLFVLVMAGVVGAFLVTDRQRGEVRHLQADVDEQYREAARRIDQLDQLQQDKKLMMQRKRVAEVLVERIPRSVILAELTNLMPSTLSLLEFNMETKVLRTAARPRTAIQREAQKNQKDRKKLAGRGQPEVKPTELSLSLVGVAPTDLEVSQFLSMLNQHELFENIFLRYSEGAKIQDREMRRFEVELTLNQNIAPDHLGAGNDLTMDPMGDTISINQEGRRVLTDPKVSPVSSPANGKDQ